MWKFVNLLLLLPFFLFGQELEVRLATRSASKPIYLSRLHTDPSEYNWRYFEELRSVLEFDLNGSGFCSVLPKQDELEKSFHFPDVRSGFNLTVWRKEKIPYAIAIQVFQNRFIATAFNIEKGTTKQYPGFFLTGRLEEDRVQLHHLHDTIQKDFFGVEGIASLRILYAQRVKNQGEGLDWISEICVCDSDGANARQLTSEKSYCLSPYFLPKSASASPEDPEFFYVSEKNGQSKIYRSSFSNLQGELMVELRGNQALPSLSKKGSQMAFITDVAGRPDLFIQNLDPKGKMIGKARQLFSSARATQASPSFSPDGKQIAFVSDKDGPPRVYLLPVVGSKETLRQRPRLLTRKNRENTSPSWSPDGTKLAYSAKTDGVRQIWIYDFATEEEIQLTTGPETKRKSRLGAR